MPLATEETVRETYRVAVQENLKNYLKTPQEFDRYISIVKVAAERIDAERAASQTDHTSRLAEAREVILREYTGHMLDHSKPDWAADQLPSAEKIDLLARNRVQADHEKRIATIRVDEVDQYRALKSECRERAARADHAHQVRKDHAQDAFTTANQLSPQEAKSQASQQGRSGPSQSQRR